MKNFYPGAGRMTSMGPSVQTQYHQKKKMKDGTFTHLEWIFRGRDIVLFIYMGAYSFSNTTY
jgi:hypothetical protein